MSQEMINFISMIIASFLIYMLFFKDKNKKKNNNIHNERSNEESKLLESNIDKKIGISSIEDLESNHLINEEKVYRSILASLETNVGSTSKKRISEINEYLNINLTAQKRFLLWGDKFEMWGNNKTSGITFAKEICQLLG